jgi:hypothetical protein
LKKVDMVVEVAKGAVLENMLEEQANFVFHLQVAVTMEGVVEVQVVMVVM